MFLYGILPSDSEAKNKVAECGNEVKKPTEH